MGITQSLVESSEEEKLKIEAEKKKEPYYLKNTSSGSKIC